MKNHELLEHAIIFAITKVSLEGAAHLRDGRVWIGTPQQEDAVRSRIQEIDEERLVIENAHDGVLPQEADNALALAERSSSRNPLRRLLQEKRAFQ